VPTATGGVEGYTQINASRLGWRIIAVSIIVPILHAGGFSWDEALVLVVAILAVPAISFFTGRFGKRQATEAHPPRRRRASEPTEDDIPIDANPVE
jgi:hypothetical protein